MGGREGTREGERERRNQFFPSILKRVTNLQTREKNIDQAFGQTVMVCPHTL